MKSLYIFLNSNIGKATVTFLLLIITIFYIVFFTPKKHIGDYYELIANQEHIGEDFTISEEELEKVRACGKKSNKYKKYGSPDDCYRDFYKQYTIKYGPEKGFEHLAYVQKNYPNLLPGCHYISHGMGNGTVVREKGDVYKAFDIMLQSTFFKNIATCGNGYFHGVIEEYAGDIYDKVEMSEKLKVVCEKRKQNCYHGVGHAVVTQFGFHSSAIEDGLYVCDQITKKLEERFGCYTGLFMEVAQQDNDVISVGDGIMNFKLCDTYDGMKKTACYLEQSGFFEHFTKEPRNYAKNMYYCKQIESEMERMACVKLFAIRSVRISRYEEVKKMCDQTTTSAEKVMCTAIVAERVGGSMDKTYKTREYIDAVYDVCKSLNPYLAVKCSNLVFKERNRLFYTSEVDLLLPKTTFKNYKDFFLSGII